MLCVQLLRVSVHERISAAAEDFLLQLEKGEEVSVRALLTERLTAAAEDIVALIEETVAEYEDRAERSEREMCRQRRLLDALLKPQVKLRRHTADVQQLLVNKEEVPSEQQERSPSVEQEDPEPPHIKEEQEEVWTSQEGEQLQGLEEVKEEEEDEEKPESSQLQQMETEADGEDCEGPEPASNSHPDPHLTPDTEDKIEEFCVAEIEVSCDDWEETRETQAGLHSHEEPVSEVRCDSPDKPFSCSQCGKRFTKSGYLEIHMRTHTGEKPFSCSVCGKKYTKKGYLIQHMGVHRREKRHTCSVCSKRLVWHSGAECHKCVGGSSQPQLTSSSSSECDKRCCYSHHLKKDLGAHAEENLFSCSVCGKKFTQRGYLIQHMARHTGKIRFRCCICDKRFVWRHELKSHKCDGDSSQSQTEEDREGDREDGGGSDSDDKTSDSSEPETELRDNDRRESRESQSGLNPDAPVGEVGSSSGNKSFICSECGKTFCGEENLKTHMKTHTGEKPFSCSFCEKGLTRPGYLTNNMSVHTEEKRFLYCVCGKRFAWRYNLKNHPCDGESTQSQIEENREAEPPANSSNMSDSSKPQTELTADDCNKSREASLNSLKNNKLLEGDGSSDSAERPFSCSKCPKRFRRKKNLQEHLRIHTGEKPYGCSVCMKYFSCSGSLRKHLRIHTGEKPFSCSVCGNRFTESGHLKVHMRTHTGEKPFSCSVCGKSFTWRQSFNNHMKYHADPIRQIN